MEIYLLFYFVRNCVRGVTANCHRLTRGPAQNETVISDSIRAVSTPL